MRAKKRARVAQLRSQRRCQLSEVPAQVSAPPREEEGRAEERQRRCVRQRVQALEDLPGRRFTPAAARGEIYRLITIVSDCCMFLLPLYTLQYKQYVWEFHMCLISSLYMSGQCAN